MTVTESIPQNDDVVRKEGRVVTIAGGNFQQGQALGLHAQGRKFFLPLGCLTLRAGQHQAHARQALAQARQQSDSGTGFTQRHRV